MKAKLEKQEIISKIEQIAHSNTDLRAKAK